MGLPASMTLGRAPACWSRSTAGWRRALRALPMAGRSPCGEPAVAKGAEAVAAPDRRRPRGAPPQPLRQHARARRHARRARTLLLAHGFTTWKDNYFYERVLGSEPQPGTSRVRRAGCARSQGAPRPIFIQGFPNSDHCIPSLQKRELEVIAITCSRTVTAWSRPRRRCRMPARRGWLKLVAGDAPGDARQAPRQAAPARGCFAEEAKHRTRAIALEVLADNARPSTSPRASASAPLDRDHLHRPGVGEARRPA